MMPEPAAAEAVDDGEKPLGVALRERAGRLVEDDHPGVREQGPGHLDELLGADAEVADAGIGADVGMLEQREHLGHEPPMLAAVDDSARGRAPGRA